MAGNDADALNEHKRFLEDMAERLLAPYSGRLTPGTAPRHYKEFNDSVWGTCSLSPLELAILDSPLLQRLRSIRQLGVAHWVYPGATHSRFEHTLGVVRQVQSLVTSINTHAAPDGGVYIDKRWTKLLRLAALCHDVGHGVMSHVSENALVALPSTTGLLLAFSDAFELDRPKPSEIAAYYLVGSAAFSHLLQVAQVVTRDHELPEDAIALIQNVIIGKPINDLIPLLHELINGPFDADKLDYMPRDAQMSGIPVITDIDRLVQKVRAVRMTQDELPKPVAMHVQGGHANYTLIGVALSGARALDELMLGRTLLFDKIYRHHKVRSAEAMVASLLYTISDVVSPTPLQVPYLFTDESLLDLDQTRVAQLAARPLSQEEETRAMVASDLAERLRTRRLFVRAFAYASAMPLDPYRLSPEQQTGLLRLMALKDDPIEARRDLIARVCDETRTILQLLDCEQLLEDLPGRELRPYVWLDPPAVPPHPNDVAHAYLVTEDRKVIRFRDDFAETRGWADAYPLTRDTGYIFAPRELAPYVFLAAQKVVRHEFKVRIPTGMVQYAKQDPATLDTLRSQLLAEGFYASSPADLQPLPGRLRKADISSRLHGIVGRLTGYCGPILPAEGIHQDLLNEERVLDWVRQFETDDLSDAAMQVLEKVRLIGRHDLVSALDTFLREHPEFAGAYLCPLGAPRDSSSLTTYFAGDLGRERGLRVTDLYEALAGEGPIIFTDDIIGSGSQAINILETWLGIASSVDLGERRAKLPESLATVLHTRHLGFVYAAGMAAGKARLERRLSELDIRAVVHVGVTDLPRAFDGRTIKPPKRETAFKQRCQELGHALLLDEETGHDAAWVQERCLGYGNEGLLIIFPYNTPSQTLTCLWQAGTVNGIPWTPLFPRRKKE